jgi:pimeloyl-ACP methyl ester carboxylesterase/AraC-like DNA-binding protein
MKPPVKYTKSGRINIAYQVFGTGSVDLVYIPGWISNIDFMWKNKHLLDFLTALGKMARVILFDKRGTGLSDRIVELSSLEERMDDIRAVMDAAGSEKAILFGHSEGGSVSALFSATYPNKVISLITFGIFAKRKYAPHYPWAPTDAERQAVYHMIEKDWGTDNMDLASLAPSMSEDQEFMDWLADYFRSGASPGAALAITKMNTEVDIINILASIQVPTLILQRNNDVDVNIEEGKFIAERIPHARFVELQGDDHLFWVGDTWPILMEIGNFIMESKPRLYQGRKLVTFVAGRISPKGPIEDHQKEFLTQFITKHHGRMASIMGNIFFSLFQGPSKAIHCCLELLGSAGEIGVQLAFAVHIKEAYVDALEFVDVNVEFVATRILALAPEGHVLTTQTIKYLISDNGLEFTPLKTPIHPIDGEQHHLYFVREANPLYDHRPTRDREMPTHESFLENVLLTIEANLENPNFGIEMLCDELGVGERNLQRKLKSFTSKSPIQLIASVRLHWAKQLLLERSGTIKEVAYRTGFSSPSYFSKSFKREFGVSPKSILKD